MKQRDELLLQRQRALPLFVKVSPDLTEAALEELCQVLVEVKIDGVIATNTTLNREAVVGSNLALETGGLSGAPLLEQSLQVVRVLRRELPLSIPIIGVGGILGAADAVRMFESGAALVQLYSGLIYQGPRVVSEVALAAKEWCGGEANGTDYSGSAARLDKDGL